MGQGSKKALGWKGLRRASKDFALREFSIVNDVATPDTDKVG